MKIHALLYHLPSEDSKAFKEMSKKGTPVKKVAVGTLGGVTVLNRD